MHSRTTRKNQVSGRKSGATEAADLETIVTKLKEYRAENVKKLNGKRVDRRKHGKRHAFAADTSEYDEKVLCDVSHWRAGCVWFVIIRLSAVLS